MKIIFLEFNGILDTNEKMDEINYDNLLRLKTIVEKTDAKIVISSSIKILIIEQENQVKNY